MTIAEIIKAIKGLKNRKLPGVNKICAYLSKVVLEEMSAAVNEKMRRHNMIESA